MRERRGGRSVADVLLFIPVQLAGANGGLLSPGQLVPGRVHRHLLGLRSRGRCRHARSRRGGRSGGRCNQHNAGHLQRFQTKGTSLGLGHQTAIKHRHGTLHHFAGPAGLRKAEDRRAERVGARGRADAAIGEDVARLQRCAGRGTRHRQGFSTGNAGVVLVGKSGRGKSGRSQQSASEKNLFHFVELPFGGWASRARVGTVHAITACE